MQQRSSYLSVMHAMTSPPTSLSVPQRLVWLSLAWTRDQEFERWLHSRAHRTWPDEPFLLGWFDEAAVMEASGLTHQEVLDAAAALVERGIVEQRGGNDGDGYLWRLIGRTTDSSTKPKVKSDAEWPDPSMRELYRAMKGDC